MKRNLVRTILGTLAALGLYVGSVTGASAALPTSGQCGILAVMPHTFDPDGAVNSTYHLDVLAVIDFSTNLISYNLTEVTIESVPPNKRYSVSGQVAFTTSPGVFATGYPGNSYTLTFQPATFTNPSGATVTPAPVSYNLLLVNSDHTILVQGDKGWFHGVCQMF